jgi:hypothetical protein
MIQKRKRRKKTGIEDTPMQAMIRMKDSFFVQLDILYNKYILK